MNPAHNYTPLHSQKPIPERCALSLVPSDHELTQSIGRGNTSSIGALYERHRSKVYSLCLRMTGNTAEAEDLTQEVFIQLLVKAGSFRGESQFTTWLYRFTINQGLMYFRRTTRRLERTPNLFVDLETSPFVRYSLNSKLMDGIALDAAVAKLPYGARSVFLKFDVEGYSHHEIAQIFGCSVGNSKSQLHKARKKLRSLLTLKRSAAVV
jgi:RNA polymerase sigma-70 factor (ECF subfamily)